jgi:hypothetical protein
VITALNSGFAVRYVFEVELRVPRLLVDKKLAGRSVSRTFHFDTLTGEFRVVFGPENPRVVSVRTLEEAQQVAFRINDVPVLPLEKLLAGTTHTLRVRARVEKAGASLPFEGLMQVFSTWGFQTEWHEIRFTY